MRVFNYGKKERIPVHHVQMTDGKSAIIQQLLQENDIQDALEDLLGGNHQRNDGDRNGSLSWM